MTFLNNRYKKCNFYCFQPNLACVCNYISYKYSFKKKLQKLGFIAGRTFVTQIVIIYSILVITKKLTFIKKKN